MNNGYNPKLRLGMTLQEAKESIFRSGIAKGPLLPIVTYELVGKQAPSLLPTPEESCQKRRPWYLRGPTQNGRHCSMFSARAAPPCHTATGREACGRVGGNIRRT